MDQDQIINLASNWAHDVLTWVGFGTIVGLLAKAIMPGKDPGGSVATLVMGIGGTVIGCGTMAFFTDGERITPISPHGFAVATGGALLILFFYKLLGGYWFTEDEGPLVRRRKSRRSSRSRAAEVVYDD